MKKLLFILLIFISITFAFASIINIPADQPTIQAGINAATNSDTVLVQPETYLENINYNGKLITVASLFYTTQDTSYISLTIIDGNQVDTVVRFESGENSNSILTGFTITNGQGESNIYGGGITCKNNSSPIISYSKIVNNSSVLLGGGVYCKDSSDPIINNTIIKYNYADQGAGVSCSTNSNPSLTNVIITNNNAEFGGAIWCHSSSPLLYNVLIMNNLVSGSAGGLSCNYNSNPVLSNVALIENSAEQTGGAIQCWSSGPTLNNVLISSNSASYYGGGIDLNASSHPLLINTTISDNDAGIDGGGIYCSGNNNPNLINCILWNNTPEEIYFYQFDNPNTVTISYSDIQGGEAGIVTNNNGTVNWLEGNINEYPLFVGTGDYPFSLQEFSPCVNAGIQDTTGLNLPEFDLAGNPRVYGGRIDMGAYENLQGVYANFTANPESGYNPLVVSFTDESSGTIVSWEWDFNNDGIIDSYSQNPEFTYIQSGIFSVALTVSDGTNEDTLIRTDYIIVIEPVDSDFSGNPLNGNIPLEVNFSDLSSGYPTTWLWDFDNDGFIDSNEQNPTHTYLEAGLYTVSLTVSDGTNEDTEIKENYITVTTTGILHEIIPLETTLYQNHPNPFNPTTTIKYNLKETLNIQIDFFNIKGQKIITLVNQNQFAGYHSIVWDGNDSSGNPVSSGLYLYKMVVNNRVIDMKKCLLLK